MSASGTANVIGWDNGGGLSRDISVLAEALREVGWNVAVNGRRWRVDQRGLVARAMGRARRTALRMATTGGLIAPPFDLNLHLEDISREYLPIAKRNVLIPNQEWIRASSLQILSAVDEVWVKTHLAERIFSELPCRVRFLGWMGMDRAARAAEVSKQMTVLHIAGASLWKGTEVVLDVWSRHPQWPLLTVLRRPRGYDGQALPWREREPARNIRIYTDFLEDERLRQMQNECAVHLCPSEAEGFGHILLESMSVGAVVVTTNAPPMNELVTEDIGLLAATERSESMSLGRRYFVSPRELEKSIERALTMTDTARRSLGLAARARFDANNRAFRTNLKSRLKSQTRAEAGGGT